MSKKKQQQQPWVVQFNGTSKPALIAPFDGCQSTHVVDMAALQGKQCLGLDGDWSIMLDELTNECSLVSLSSTSPSVISLPPLPEDTPPPPSYLRFGCALSNQTPPDCTVLLDFVREKSLLYCRPGDAGWSRLPVEFDEGNDEFDGPITPCRHHGKVYATTMASMVAVDASRPTPAIERTDLRRPPPCLVHAGYKCYPVPCPDGELFLVRCCYFGWLVPELVDVKLFRRNQEGNAWETVESIGDRTFFVGRFSFVVPSAAEAGTQPNCVHLLQGVSGKYGVYTVSLDDMTMRLTIVEGCERDEDDGEEEVFWALPSSFGLEASGATDDTAGVPSEVMQRRTEHCCNEEERKVVTTSITPSPEESQWSDLHTDLLQLLVTKISFIDFLHLKAVCKHWNSITIPIQDAKVSPLLMTTRPGRTKDLLEVFDPLSKKKYNISVSIPASDLKSQGSQLLHCTKNGWVIVSRGGDHMFFLVNPFKNYPDGGDVIALPPLNVLDLKGLSFSTMSGSPDFAVLAVAASPDNKVITIQTWRIGDEGWKEELLGDDDVPFLLASHSPVFLDGVFYFLDINGRLGVVDPNEDDMKWNVLEKPDQPIRGSDEVHTIERDYSYLVEWKDELVAILRETGDDGSMKTFKLDRPRMVWTELEGMDDAALFWDKSGALIAMLPPGEDLCNKVYLPNFTETDDGGRAPPFY